MDDLTPPPPAPPMPAPGPAAPRVVAKVVQPWPRVWFVTGPLVGFVVMALFVGMVQKVPYVSFAPGSAQVVQPLITVPPGKGSGGGDGKLLFLTVSVRNKIFGIEAVKDWLDPNVDVSPYKEIYQDQTPAESDRANKIDMDQSKHLAELVAFRKLGYTSLVTGRGAVIGDVVAGLPSAKVLKGGDVITGINGQPVRIADDVTPLVRAHKPGDSVTLTVERQGNGPAVSIQLELSRNTGNGKPIIGVTGLTTRDIHYTFPFDVGIASANVVGPSGGLVFTLGILDKLTPGSLTGRHVVAVTGEMSSDGSVLPIGGVRQKVVAAEAQGADVMIVPSDDYPDAKAKAGSRLKVYKADSIDQALAVLKSIGGDVDQIAKQAATRQSH